MHPVSRLYSLFFKYRSFDAVTPPIVHKLNAIVLRSMAFSKELIPVFVYPFIQIRGNAGVKSRSVWRSHYIDSATFLHGCKLSTERTLRAFLWTTQRARTLRETATPHLLQFNFQQNQVLRLAVTVVGYLNCGLLVGKNVT